MTLSSLVLSEPPGSGQKGAVSFRPGPGRWRFRAAVLLGGLALFGSVAASRGQGLVATSRLVQALKRLSLEELTSVSLRSFAFAERLNLPPGLDARVLAVEEVQGRGFASLAAAWPLAPVLFLVDGRVLPSSADADDREDWPPGLREEIDHLEVVVTRGVWQWEGRPIGGVINLVSRRAVETLEFLRPGERRWLRP